MPITDTPQRLRIYIGEQDKWEGKPLYEAIVLKAREMRIAGATVLRGPMGYGKSSHIHTAKILRLSNDLPLIIDIVDAKAQLDTFIPEIKKMLTKGLITLENIQIIHYAGEGK